MTKSDVDALARLLDGDPTLNGEVTPELRRLGQLAHFLATRPVLPDPPLTPEFTAELRAGIVETAREQAPAPSALTRVRVGLQTATARWRYSARTVAATAVAVLALSGSGMAIATDRAMPNDALYPAKLVLEDARIALVRDDVRRGEAHLDQAAARIAEAERAAAVGDHSSAARALLEADEAVRAGARDMIRAYQERGDARSLERLADFTHEQRGRVDRLDGLLVGDAAEAARAFSIGLDRIDARMAAVTGTCPECAGGVAPVRDGADLSVIPPAHEPFEACPCDTGPPRQSPAAPADTDALSEPPLPAPDLSPDVPPLDEVPQPAEEAPPVEVPPGDAPADEGQIPRPDASTDPPTVPEPEVPEVREPLRQRGPTVVDDITRGVVDLFR